MHVSSQPSIFQVFVSCIFAKLTLFQPRRSRVGKMQVIAEWDPSREYLPDSPRTVIPTVRWKSLLISTTLLWRIVSSTFQNPNPLECHSGVSEAIASGDLQLVLECLSNAGQLPCKYRRAERSSSRGIVCCFSRATRVFEATRLVWYPQEVSAQRYITAVYAFNEVSENPQSSNAVTSRVPLRQRGIKKVCWPSCRLWDICCHFTSKLSVKCSYPSWASLRTIPAGKF